jgi:small subunit ribosomal protein S6
MSQLTVLASLLNFVAMRPYEVLIITKTEGDIAPIRELILALKGKIVKEDLWGMRRLAYPIKKSESGYYGIFDVELDGGKVKELSTKLKLNDQVLRGLVFLKD